MDAAPTQSNAPPIRMEGVAVGSLHDPDALIAEGVDWTVSPGDYWVIAGLQGAGKSNFLSMTGGLMAPLRGRYWLFGEEMPIFDEQRLRARLRLGLVFEGGQLFNHLTVRENIGLPLRYHRDLPQEAAKADVDAMLEVMGLTSWADSTPGALSRNWQKRVGLARALMLQPELLLVDGPLTGLDLPHMDWWLSFLGELARGHRLLQKRQVTLVLTTADLRPWKGRARQFAILRNKRLSILGKWTQLEAASDDLVEELLARRSAEPAAGAEVN